MAGKLVGRLVAVLPVLVGATVVAFILLQLVPGDAADALLGFGASADARQELRMKLGLDKPIPVQYYLWALRAARGDLGSSTQGGVPVMDLLKDRVKNTLILTLGGLPGLLAGFVAGIGAALFSRRTFDRLFLVLLAMSVSIPPYWLAVVFLFFFSVSLGWFPTGGMYSSVGGGGILDLGAHLILPAILATVAPAALVAGSTRTAMLDILGKDFVRTALAKGASTRRVLLKHVLPNALPAIVNMLGLQLAYLIVGSAVFVEIVFNWPGLGLLAYQAILARDLPVVLGIVLASAVLFVTLNLLIDLSQLLLDPRLRD